MAIDTKLNLSNAKFEQLSGDTLNLSGCTGIYRKLIINSGATLSILPNRGNGKLLTSDANGNATWQSSSTTLNDDILKYATNKYRPYSGKTEAGTGSTSAGKLYLGSVNPSGRTCVLNYDGNFNATNLIARSGTTRLGEFAGYISSFSEHQTVVGLYAGCGNFCCNQTAIGVCAGMENCGNEQTAVGYLAGHCNVASGQVAIGCHAGFINSGEDQIAIGSCAGCQNTGLTQISIGRLSGLDNFGGIQIAIGNDSGNFNRGDTQLAVGHDAGCYNSGATQVAIGFGAGVCNKGTCQVAIGCAAGSGNTACNQVAIGREAGHGNTGTNQVAVGTSAGIHNIGDDITAIGNGAGQNNSGNTLIAIGSGAGSDNCATQLIAVGNGAGSCNHGDYSIAIGLSTGLLNNGSELIAIGGSAGCNNVGNCLMAIGTVAGGSNSGNTVIAIGCRAALSNSGNLVIAIGDCAGCGNTGDFLVAIGSCAGSGNTLDYKFILRQGCLNNNRPLICGDFDNGDVEMYNLTLSSLTGATTSAIGVDATGRIIKIASGSTSSSTVTGATNLGSGNGTIFTNITNNKINLKTLSGGTNTTLTCNGSYIGINSCDPKVTQLAGFTGSTKAKLDYLGVWSGLTNTKITALGVFTGATNAKLTQLAGFTGSTKAKLDYLGVWSGLTQAVTVRAITGATNGLTKTVTNKVCLGGTLGASLTTLSLASPVAIFQVCYTGNSSLLVSGAGTAMCTCDALILLNGDVSLHSCSNNNLCIYTGGTLYCGTSPGGIRYNADYSSSYTSRSLVDREYVDNKVFTGTSANAITGATNLGSGNGTVFTNVTNNKINLKTLSGGTNVTLTCNGSYIGINATAVNWTGSTANGVGTYVSASRICSQPNMTFDGTQLKVTGNVCATTCVRSALVSGTTTCGLTAVCGGIVCGGTCASSPIAIGTTCVCSPRVLGSTYVCSPVITGSTKVCSPIVLGTTCICSPTFCTTGQMISTLATSTSPFNVASTTLNINLNADYLDGIHGSGFTTTGLFNTYTGDTKVTLDFHQTEIDRLSTLQGGVTYYFEHHASTIGGYEELLRVPITLSGVTETVNLNNNTQTFDSYATVAGEPSLTGISAGLWTIHFHVQFSSVTGVNQVHADVYTRTTGGTETFRFRMSTPDIGVITLVEYQLQDIRSGFTMNPSDRIVVKLLAQTTGGAKTASFQYGSLTNFAFIIPPFTVSTAPLWSNVQAKPSWLTGTTLSAFEAGHSHSQYTLQTTFNAFTGTTLPANYYNKAQINAFTGTTLPTNYYNKTQINSYTGKTNTRINTIETNYVTGATNLGSGNGTIFTSVNAHKIQLKSLSGGTNVTLTCNGNYVAINASASGTITGGANGLSTSGSYVVLGGALTGDTTISGGGKNLFFDNINCYCLSSPQNICINASGGSKIVDISGQDGVRLNGCSGSFICVGTTSKICANCIALDVTGGTGVYLYGLNAKTSETCAVYIAADGKLASGAVSAGSPMAVCTISGNSSATGFTVNHGCNQQFVMVQVVQAASPHATVYTDVQRPNANCVCIMFNTAPASGTNYKILIIG